MAFLRAVNSTQGRLLIFLFIVAMSVIYYYSSKNEIRGPDSKSQGVKSGPDVLIYNRIPKTGSTTLMQLPYKLYKENRMSVMLVNITGGPTSYTMTLKDRTRFSRNVTRWKDPMPALYHGHFAYFDTKIGDFDANTNVKWINVIRRPIERMVSYYYFLRYGDDFRINKIRSKMGDKMSFDECVERRHQDCDPKKLWLQVPWFCGHFKKCWSPPGNPWALQQAKFNLANNYFLVGVTDELETFIDILEWTLPDFFRGAGDLYKKEDLHIRKTRHKDTPSEKTLDTLTATKVWKAENDFYEFALAHFKAAADEYKEAVKSNYLNKEHFYFDKIRIQSIHALKI